MNSGFNETIFWTVAAFCLVAIIVWSWFDDERLREQEARHYSHMVCLYRHDIANGIRPEHAKGWPNYKGIAVDCTGSTVSYTF